jgi:hypothetical protein
MKKNLFEFSDWQISNQGLSHRSAVQIEMMSDPRTWIFIHGRVRFEDDHTFRSSTNAHQNRQPHSSRELFSEWGTQRSQLKIRVGDTCQVASLRPKDVAALVLSSLQISVG